MLCETLKQTALAVNNDNDMWHGEHTRGILIDAMDEARRICRAPRVKDYTNMDDLREALLGD